MHGPPSRIFNHYDAASFFLIPLFSLANHVLLDWLPHFPRSCPTRLVLLPSSTHYYGPRFIEARQTGRPRPDPRVSDLQQGPSPSSHLLPSCGYSKSHAFYFCILIFLSVIQKEHADRDPDFLSDPLVIRFLGAIAPMVLCLDKGVVPEAWSLWFNRESAETNVDVSTPFSFLSSSTQTFLPGRRLFRVARRVSVPKG